ncbi:isochorismatase family protein [Nocardioides ochotonae]|uniref:isochorismatase family protein n=1 Tax=Nocardioides ochotonae TaxID=2685869 RepID=UPI00140B60A5|nr:isochorismatase family protein [Nocardioides ochotonae]
MSLPALIEYAAPLADLPPSRAPWQLESGRAAVLVHDMQRYFLRPYAPTCPALVGAVDSTARILAAARAAGVPVFYTAQTGSPADNQTGGQTHGQTHGGATPARGLQGDLWGPGMSAVPEHTEIVEPLAPAPGETVLVKHRYSAFAHSDLAERLASAGRDQLVITGVYAHIGVTATAMDGFMREVHPFVVADAVADFGPEQHRLALAQVASCAGVVTTTDQVVAALATSFRADDLPAAPADWAGCVRAALVEVLDAGFADAAFAEPEADLFTLGLNSLRAFDLLDRLADDGVDIDFADLTREPTLAFVLRQGAVRAELVS